MKLLYSVIILAIIQLVVIKPLEAYTKSKKPIFKQKLLEIYKNEMVPLDNSYCEKIKFMSEKLLQYRSIKQAKTVIMRQFKQNMTEFLQEYPLYMRYGLRRELTFEFDKKFPRRSFNKEKQYIRQLIGKLGYNDLIKDYINNTTKLVKQKLLPKFEELIKQLSPQEIKLEKDLINLYHDLSRCPDYYCQYIYLNRLEDPSPKLLLFDYINENLYNLHIVYGSTTLNISQAILMDHRLSQLPSDLKNDLTNNIKDFISQFRSHKTIQELINLTHLFFTDILSKYYHNKTLPSQQQNLIKRIFDDHGCNEFGYKFTYKLNNFLRYGLSEKFKKFKADLNGQELEKAKPLLQWYDGLKDLHKPEDILKAFDNLKQFK